MGVGARHPPGPSARRAGRARFGGCWWGGRPGETPGPGKAVHREGGVPFPHGVGRGWAHAAAGVTSSWEPHPATWGPGAPCSPAYAFCTVRMGPQPVSCSGGGVSRGGLRAVFCTGERSGKGGSSELCPVPGGRGRGWSKSCVLLWRGKGGHGGESELYL